MPSMRLFRKRKSLAPGQGDATTRDIPESTRLPSAGAPQSEQQATLADVPAGASAGPEGVSKGDVQRKSGHATSSDDVLFSPSAATEAEPIHRAEDEAATRQQIGRRNSKKDRFRLFRSRSSHFRKGTDEGGKGSGSSGGGTKSRLSWPAPRSTTGSTPAPEPPRGRPEFETVDKSVSATADASPPPPLAAGPVRDQRQQQQSQQKQQRRPNSVIGAGASPSTASVDTSSSPSWRLQSLKRLPSLSLKRRLSKSHKLKPPQVIVTPATVVSAFLYTCTMPKFPFLFGVDGTFRWVERWERGDGGTLACLLAQCHTPVHQIRPHILPQIHQPIMRDGLWRTLPTPLLQPVAPARRRGPATLIQWIFSNGPSSLCQIPPSWKSRGEGAGPSRKLCLSLASS